MVTDRLRLLVILSALLIAGFLAVSIGSYMVSRDSLRKSIIGHALPLTGDTIYSEIQKDILRPIFISSLMANDTFVRDWVLEGERDAEKIARYLKEIAEKYGARTSFLVSERTLNYYHTGGVLKKVRPDEPRDAWYYRVRTMNRPYELNVDPDMANQDTTTIFINYRVYDYQGNFIAATGVGLPLDTVSARIDSYQARFKRRIYFVDSEGRITLAASKTAKGSSIRDNPAMSGLADRILRQSSVPVKLEYPEGGSSIMLNSRHIPELNWFLIVEQDDTEAVKPIRQILLVNLLVAMSITLLVLATALYTVNRYQRRLEHAAVTDPLTGLMNRHAFDLFFSVALMECRRNNQPLSAIMIDIDLFKQINDELGHLAGDRALKSISDTVRSQLRKADIMARWGGEEFMVLLKDCNLDNAKAVAEKLRAAVEAQRLGPGPNGAGLTISLGVTQFVPGDTADSLFSRADAALYLAKRNGRNRVEAERA